MSQSTTATTQGSRSVIDSLDNVSEHEKTSSFTPQGDSSAIPVIPRRSSYNYAQDSASFSGLGGNPSTGRLAESADTSQTKPKDSDVEGLQRKLFHERKKSYTVEDQKRVQHEFMLKNDKNPQSFSEV
jgi:hypothetical protein